VLDPVNFLCNEICFHFTSLVIVGVYFFRTELAILELTPLNFANLLRPLADFAVIASFLCDY
jgi:hypothetical protein